VESFQSIKEMLTMVPILKVPDLDEDLLVCTDASKVGLCGFLM
jgi:hypothetical protein